MSMYITSLMRVLIGVFILMFGFWRLWLIFLRLRYSGLFIIAVHNCVRNVLAIFILNGVNHLTWFFLICFFFLKPKKFLFACCRVIYDITWSWFSYFVLFLGTLRPKSEISASNLGIARFFLVSSSGLLSKGFGLNLRLKINSTFCLKFS